MKWKSNSTQYENPPVGSHIARCYALIDLGTQTHASAQFGVRQQRDVRLSFELPLTKMTGQFNKDVKGKPFAVHLNVKQSLHPKANLRKFLKGWRGRDFADGEIEKFDPRKLVGLPCRVSLVQNGEYINVDSVSPLGVGAGGKKEVCPKQVNKSVYLSLDETEYDEAVFASLHESTRTKIQKSPEWQALNGSGPEEAQGDAPQDETDPDYTEPGSHIQPDDSDVPF